MKLVISQKHLEEELAKACQIGKDWPQCNPALTARNCIQSLLGSNKLKLYAQVSKEEGEA